MTFLGGSTQDGSSTQTPGLLENHPHGHLGRYVVTHAILCTLPKGLVLFKLLSHV